MPTAPALESADPSRRRQFASGYHAMDVLRRAAAEGRNRVVVDMGVGGKGVKVRGRLIRNRRWSLGCHKMVSSGGMTVGLGPT